MCHYETVSETIRSIPFSNPSVALAVKTSRAHKQIISHIIDFFRPGAIVLQMGADSLAGDKLGGFNLTLDGELALFDKCADEQVILSVHDSSSPSGFP